MENSNLTIFSESPRYLEVNEEEETLKKEVLHSVATALANMVLPVPGGPTINTPFKGRRMPKKNRSNLSGDAVISIIQMYEKSICLYFSRISLESKG